MPQPAERARAWRRSCLWSRPRRSLGRCLGRCAASGLDRGPMLLPWTHHRAGRANGGGGNLLAGCSARLRGLQVGRAVWNDAQAKVGPVADVAAAFPPA